MNVAEFSAQFDTLYNNIMSNAAPGLDEYEKSVFLTKAQNELVKNYFNPKSNKLQEGFDGSAKRQSDFSMLMQHQTVTLGEGDTFDHRALTAIIPSTVFILLNETVELSERPSVPGGNNIPAGGDVTPISFKTEYRQVIPIKYDEYTRLMSKPYKEPLKNQAWRIMTSVNDGESVVEIILRHNDLSNFQTRTYNIRFVRKPNPIILEDLGDLQSIDGQTEAMTCELDSTIHEEILQRAVELAKAAYSSDQSGQAQFQNQVSVGQRSE